MQVQPPTGLHELARNVVTNQARQPLARADELGQIDARIVAHQLQSVHDLFGANVAGGTGRIRTAADAAKRRVEAVGACGNAGQHVGQSDAACVVEMQRQFGGNCGNWGQIKITYRQVVAPPKLAKVEYKELSG